MPTHELSKKIALVTGGGSGIGAAIALKLGDMDGSIVVCGRKSAPLKETVRKIEAEGGHAEAAVCDVTDWSSVQALATGLKKTYGQLDVLVNNAGAGGYGGPLHAMPLEQWDTIFNTNLRGVFYMIRAFAPLMISGKGGHIINISSLAGKNPLPNAAAYGASKWGLNGLSYSVGEELRAHNIRVSVVCPGSVHTEFSPQIHAGKSAEKMLQPGDVAHIVGMLVTQSPQSFASEVLLRPTQKP